MVGVKPSLDSFPPFPDDVPTAPIARISSLKLLNGDLSEGSKVLEACQTYGFFYLDLRDSTEGETLLDESEQLLQLAIEAFKDPLEEKMKYHLQKGVSIFGYKAAGSIKKTDPTLRPDTTEFFNISKDHMHDIVSTRSYPPTIKAHHALLKAFTKNAHECGMLVLRTLEVQLGLEPHELVNLNMFEKPAGDHCRLTRKFPYSADANVIGLPSHTDFGSVTVLFNWLGGLQIESRSPGREVEWEFVRPVAGHAVINLGMDASYLCAFLMGMFELTTVR